MTRDSRAKIRALALIASIGGASAACGTSSLPPHGEALFIVDTDLPVPSLAGRLRVDLYAEDGTWFESRDIGRSDPLDWPASFSVFSDDDSKKTRVLVRIRAYPEGVVRDYAGERFSARSDFQEPHVATSLAELCASAPDLPIGGRVKLRRGGTAITDFVADPSGSCVPPNAAGSIAARVTIAQKGTYLFDVADSFPYMVDSILFLRKVCADPSSQIACTAEPMSPGYTSGHFPRFQSSLEPGTYFLVTGGLQPNFPADITLEALAIDDPQSIGGASGNAAAPPPTPRLLQAGANGGPVDVTPSTEPLPSAAVDRLVLVELTPGARGAARVTLRGACSGTMAKLGAAQGAIDPTNATTCVDTENVRVAVSPIELGADLTIPRASEQGAFGKTDPCAPSEQTNADVVCVPGGAFLFGGPDGNPNGFGLYPSVPQRTAVMPKLFIDKREITVAKMRAAIAAGLPADSRALFVNDGPFWKSLDDPFANACSYSSTPMGREQLGVSCVSWRLARAYCQSVGGDLPTEAQWEYVASAAGRPFKTLYPWGNDEPTCARTPYDRLDQAGDPSDCALTLKVAPGPVALATGAAIDGTTSDVTPLGVVDMAGGLSEWVLDSAAPYDGACWGAASLTSPRCWEENATHRVIRGMSWADEVMTPASVRTAIPGEEGGAGITLGAPPDSGTGFRCVYTGAPK
jgi:formylglycine-generating enzyme required for sulfatase activity